MNIHTPERQPNESQAQYRERRAMSNSIAKSLGAARNGGPSARQKLRDKQRENGNLRGVYGVGVVAAQSRRQRDALPKVGQRDEHGAFTLVGAQPCEPWQGQKRRKWLGGISAQRGY